MKFFFKFVLIAALGNLKLYLRLHSQGTTESVWIYIAKLARICLAFIRNLADLLWSRFEPKKDKRTDLDLDQFFYPVPNESTGESDPVWNCTPHSRCHLASVNPTQFR